MLSPFLGFFLLFHGTVLEHKFSSRGCSNRFLLSFYTTRHASRILSDHQALPATTESFLTQSETTMPRKPGTTCTQWLDNEVCLHLPTCTPVPDTRGPPVGCGGPDPTKPPPSKGPTISCPQYVGPPYSNPQVTTKFNYPPAQAPCKCCNSTQGHTHGFFKCDRCSTMLVRPQHGCFCMTFPISRGSVRPVSGPCNHCAGVGSVLRTRCTPSMCEICGARGRLPRGLPLAYRGP